MAHLRNWGAVYILALFMVLTTIGWWHQSYAVSRSEREQECEQIKAIRLEATCPEWNPQDQRTEFWGGLFENERSEDSQLLKQAIIIAALGGVWFLKEKEDSRRIEAKIDYLRGRIEDGRG